MFCPQNTEKKTGSEKLYLASYLSCSRKDVSPLDSASLVASEISNAISAQKVELEERNKTVEMLQKAMVSVVLYKQTINVYTGCPKKATDF